MHYIIKNCPANYQNNCRSAKVHSYMCKDATDCVLKQIVEAVSTFKSSYADVVLNKLEIEEVNER